MRMNSAKSLDVSLVTFSSPHFAILFIHACAVINVLFKKNVGNLCNSEAEPEVDLPS